MVHSPVNYIYLNCSDFRHLCVDNCDSYERSVKLKTPKIFFRKIKFNPNYEFSISGYHASAIITKDPQDNHAIYIRVGFVTNGTASSVLECFAKKGLELNENT